MTESVSLERAFRLLREQSDGSYAAVGRSRMQILARAREQARRRRRIVIALVPIAAVFLASFAWAAASGRLERWFGIRASVTAPVAAGGSGAQGSARASDVPLETPTPEVVAAAPAPPASASAPSVGRPHAASSARATSPSPSASAVSAREQTLYTAAHHAHFVEHDAAAALSGWNAYLAEFPDGRFALEARYNRAIALVRLGRRSEAASALEPFANGTQGGYREHEARDLLDALRDAGAD